MVFDAATHRRFTSRHPRYRLVHAVLGLCFAAQPLACINSDHLKTPSWITLSPALLGVPTVIARACRSRSMRVPLVLGFQLLLSLRSHRLRRWSERWLIAGKIYYSFFGKIWAMQAIACPPPRSHTLSTFTPFSCFLPSIHTSTLFVIRG